MDLRLTGRRALVTGASDGIGAATARLLAAEGVIVGVHGRNAERIAAVVSAIRDAGGEAHPLEADLGTDESVTALADAALAALGEVDLLVCNAGGRSPGEQGWAQTEMNAYQRTWQLNVGSAVRLIKQLAPGMQARGFGRIVLLSSAAGLEPIAAQPDYGAAKAALVNLAVSTAKWLRSSGVTVNAVSPGAVLTDTVRAYLQRIAVQRGWPDDWDTIETNAVRAMFRIPVGRIGRVEDVASMIAYLCSPWAGYVHGANIHIDGGVIGTTT